MPFLHLKNPRTGYYLLSILVFTVIVIVLFFGLRPKKWLSANNVHWLADEKALSFRDPGIAYVDELRISAEEQQVREWSLQIIVAPENLDRLGFRPIVTIHNGDDRLQFTLWQWGDSLIVMNGDDYTYSRKWPRISAMNVLSAGKVSFITVTSSHFGTRLFINGALAKEMKNWQITLPHGGKKQQLLLGNSVYGQHSWEGEIFGLVLYGKSMTRERVQHDYEKWLHNRMLLADSLDEPLFLYTFREGAGSFAADSTGNSKSLQIPTRQLVLQKTFLAPPWHNFTLNRSFWVDAIVNFSGFVPLGALLCLWLRQLPGLSGKYAAPVCVAFCFFLSLSIEIAQAWLPNRFSSLSDLVLNTLGAWTGVFFLEIVLRVRGDQAQEKTV